MQQIRLMKRQRGATMIGTLVIVAILGLGLYSVIRLTPVYLEYFEIARAMQSVAKENKPEDTNPAQIHTALERHWEIEDIKSLDYKDVEVRKVGSGYELHAEYEARAPFIANVSWAIAFDKTVTMN